MIFWDRYLTEALARDLDKKFVFITGPRQVGKTTLAQSLENRFPNTTYLNYDADRDRPMMVKAEWDRSSELVILDEIHKYPRWKRFVKGIYDTEGVRPRLLVTGSARLDIYRRGGDSLAGRYYLYRLHPFSVHELLSHMKPQEALKAIMTLGGFPEPLIGQSEDEARRWRRQHIERIVREDIRELEPVRDVRLLLLLVELLRERVGSTISYASLARDLEVSPHTVKRWVEILEDMYLIFRVLPYHRNIARAIIKEPKVYFYDTGSVRGDEGARFENAVACALKKWIAYCEDTQGKDLSLNFVRDKEKRAVDFLLCEDRKPRQLFEAKWSDANLSPHLRYYKDFLKTEAVQLVGTDVRTCTVSGIQIESAARFLAKLEA